MEQSLVRNTNRYSDLIEWDILVRRNSSNRANFIRIPPDASPTLVKDLFFRKYRHTVNKSMD